MGWCRVLESSGVEQLDRLRKCKEVLEEQEARGKEYLEKVKHDVEQDLAPLREEVEGARLSVEAFIREENNGEKFRCPGLGTAYLTKRLSTKIVDEKMFAESARTKISYEELESLYAPPKLLVSDAKKFAEAVLKEDGELLSGVESEEVESLTVRFG